MSRPLFAAAAHALSSKPVPVEEAATGVDPGRNTRRRTSRSDMTYQTVTVRAFQLVPERVPDGELLSIAKPRQVRNYGGEHSRARSSQRRGPGRELHQEPPQLRTTAIGTHLQKRLDAIALSTETTRGFVQQLQFCTCTQSSSRHHLAATSVETIARGGCPDCKSSQRAASRHRSHQPNSFDVPT